MEELNETMSLTDIAAKIQNTINSNNSALEDAEGTPLGFQFPEEVVEKLDEARFLCLLTDVYLREIDRFFDGDISIQTFFDNLDREKASLK